MIMETKKNISYIPVNLQRDVREKESQANKDLSRLNKVIRGYGETLTDAQEYQQKGGDWKVKAEVANCQQWLIDTKAPKYLHQQSLEAAVNSFGSEALEYYSTLTPGTLNVRFGNLSSDPLLNLSTDVIETQTGEWVISEDFIKNYLESHRRTLTNDEMEDIKAFREMQKVMDNFAKRGYNPAETYTQLSKLDDETQLAERLMYLKGFVNVELPTAEL